MAYEEYPKAIYHPTKDESAIVHSAEEEAKLQKEWRPAPKSAKPDKQ